MAVIYPANIYSGTKSPGETAVFKQLKQDSETKGWFILHSLDIADHVRNISGESDFVFIVPKKGIICLEIKASRSVRVENGMWYYGSSDVGDPRGPFKQAKEAAFSVLGKIRNIPNITVDFPVWGCVLFPYCRFDKKSIEWHSWEYSDMDDFQNYKISEMIIGYLDSAVDFLKSKPGQYWFNPKSPNPTENHCRRIADFLRPNFEFHSPLSKAEVLEGERLYYTKEQFAALDAMHTNSRVIFEGPAGTGKTLLALEAARRAATIGKKVLLICYNRLLGEWLKSETKGINGLTADSIHRYLLTYWEKMPLQNDLPDNFWNETLPINAVEHLFIEDHPIVYDEIIIDEAQDILWNQHFLDFLDLILLGGLSSGNWRIFGDFEKQNIFSESNVFDYSKMDIRLSNVPHYTLRINCRNTPRIAEYVSLLGGLRPNYSSVRRPDNGVKPNILFYKSEEEQSEILMNIIRNVFQSGWRSEDIVVLSMCSAAKSVIHLSESLQEIFSPYEHKTKNKVRYSSVFKFKGLEAPVIIITDVTEIGSLTSQKVFYTGTSRALDHLYILVDDEAKKDMLKRVMDG